MNHDEYRSVRAVNWHTLREIDKSPRHARHAMSGGLPDTPALRFGRAAHVYLLEHETFADRYAIAPDVDRRTKAGKAEYEQFTQANAGREILDREDMATLEAMWAAVEESSGRSRLLAMPHEVEHVVRWIDAATGLECKGRVDWVCPTRGILIDLKTTQDASVESFEQDMARFGYAEQLAFYADGLTAAGIPIRQTIIIAVEKSPPFGVALYSIADDSLDAGRALNRVRLQIWARCSKTNTWPSYPQHIQTIGLPAWKLRQIQALNIQEQP